MVLWRFSSMLSLFLTIIQSISLKVSFNTGFIEKHYYRLYPNFGMFNICGCGYSWSTVIAWVNVYFAKLSQSFEMCKLHQPQASWLLSPARDLCRSPPECTWWYRCVRGRVFCESDLPYIDFISKYSGYLLCNIVYVTPSLSSAE